jgi:hypothetical protein
MKQEMGDVSGGFLGIMMATSIRKFARIEQMQREGWWSSRLSIFIFKG